MSAGLILPQAGRIVACPSPIHSWTHHCVPCPCLMRPSPCRASKPLAERLADRTCRSHEQARIVHEALQSQSDCSSFHQSVPLRHSPTLQHLRLELASPHGTSEYEAVAAAFNKPTAPVSPTKGSRKRNTQVKTRVLSGPVSLRAVLLLPPRVRSVTEVLHRYQKPHVARHGLRTSPFVRYQIHVHDRVTNHWKDDAPTAQKRLVNRVTIHVFRTPPLNLSGHCRCADDCDSSRDFDGSLEMLRPIGLGPKHSCNDRIM